MNKFSLRQFQVEVGEWSRKNFGDQPSDNPLLGMSEEVGELCHAHLKGKQGIRYTEEEVRDMKIDAVADLFIYAADYACREDFDLEEAIQHTWDKIQQRDWVESPMDAHKEEA